MNPSPAPPNSTSRRQFLKTSTTAVLGGALASQWALSGRAQAPNSETLKVGLIGCGGRGTGAAAQALHADNNVMLTAMADVFPERLQASLAELRRQAPDKVKVQDDHSFIGLDAYQKVLDSGVDVVILTTPPGFRPVHLKAAVAANKHIFCEKPVATDAPGLRSVMESVAESKQKPIALVAGFCWRYNTSRRAFYQHIHDGAIGDLRAIYATYYTSPVKPMPPADRRPANCTDVEWQLRNWYNFVWLCGDSIVEQAVHSVDKIAWAMRDVPPTRAVAVGGRQIPSHGGNIYDHFEVNYEFANGERAFLACRQISGCYNDNSDYLLGTRGAGTIPNWSAPVITGENAWRYPKRQDLDMYQIEHNELFASIRSGKYLNDGDRMASTTLMALMGRMAAYTGQQITWEQALHSQENLYPENLSWTMSLSAPPMALPGITKFV
ncbi:MAG: Gfo/Idh/MocA family oxidoreductase [Verrucomicrobia bacterium]|nr:Gfo/Idh/MocA family oxidoreductase [Verrucomicrobiota bacterium]